MRVLIEKEAEDFIEKQGFDVVERVIVRKKDGLRSIKIRFPWAMKVSSKKIIHKAKIGGVIINIKTLNAAEKAFDKLSKIQSFEEVMVQEMISGETLILGIKNTPEFGEVIMFGKGGSDVEKENDISFRAVPLTGKDADEMIKEIKFYESLRSKNLNLNAVKDNILRLSKLAENYKNITEFDINPLIVNSKDAKVVDARIVFE